MEESSEPQTPRAAGQWLTRLLAAMTTAYTLFLVFATHYPNPEELVGPNPPSDKLLHLAAYATLGSLVTATVGSIRRCSWRTLVCIAATLAAFGMLDEATQPLPWFHRHADPLDWVFDCIGIAAGVGAVAAILAVVQAFSWADSRRLAGQ